MTHLDTFSRHLLNVRTRLTDRLKEVKTSRAGRETSSTDFKKQRWGILTISHRRSDNQKQSP